MPNGGQISAGSGLQLQATTPGNADTGNAHVTGTIIADTALDAYGPVPGITSNSCFGLGITFTSTSPFNLFRNSVFIGNNIAINQNPNGNLSANAVVVGRSATVYQGGCVVVGDSAISGTNASYPTSTAQNVVLGFAAFARGVYGAFDGEVIIGANSGSNPLGNEGNIIIGWATQTAGGFGHNFVIAKNASVKANNCVLLGVGSSSATTTYTIDNLIQIGNNTHTKILIGGLDFSNGMAASCKDVIDANYAALITDNAIEYTSITSPRVVTLVAANAVPKGFRLLVCDSSGSASGINTITLKRTGSDTINGLTTAVINSAYGVREVMSDGVNKWTIIRSI